ncbi:MAG: TonB-dependent receptor [Rhizobacter sp.]|nr:TonB-dependent receptor [Ferruginibacter sp.]
MKKIICILVIVCIGNIYVAQSQGKTGLVQGIVTDAGNQGKLSGAQISVAGGSVKTVADLNGAFKMYLPAGRQQLYVNYLGYNDTTVIVQVQAGAVTTIPVTLSSNYAQLSNVLVSGYTQGQAKALNQQKNADNIVNVISADQIGRFPDPNAAEALQRVPGVNIERDQGEGRYVLIRGLSPQFTSINVNGEQIPSPEADVRYVALDAIPSDQLASIEVNKSLTPDMDGDAVGGTVNLVTRTAQSKLGRLSGSIVGGYNDLMQKGNLQGQLQGEKKFGKREQLGILINASYYHNALGSDNWERAPQDNEAELRDYELIRTRLGLSTAIDYTFNKRHSIYFKTLYSRFTDREWRRRYVFIPEDEEIEKLTKDRFESQSIMSYNLGAKHNFNNFFLNYEAQYADGRQKTPYDHEIGFIASLPSELGFPNRSYPVINAPDFNNNSLYEFNEASYGKTLAKDRNFTGKFEVGKPYKTSNGSGLIKLGAKARFKKKSYVITNDVFESNGGVPNLSAFEQSPVKDKFLGGRFNLGNPLSTGAFNRYFNANPGLFELDVEGKAIDEALESFEANEDVYAGFAMVKHDFKKLMLLGGVRYEKTDVSYQSKDVLIDAAGDLSAILPVSGKSSYDFILPQAQMRYAVSKHTNIRAALTWSYARPNFSEIIPSQEINAEDNIATIGNANLKPTRSVNIDLMAEHFFGNVGIASVGVFHKDLQDFIYRKVMFGVPYPLTGTPIYPSIDVIQAQNGNDANLTGVEVAFQRKLNFLPGFLKNFSLYSNYTYTHSRANIQSRLADGSQPEAKEKLRLPGQAMHVGNLALAFESKKLVVRLAANFNGSYLSEVGPSTEEDLYVNSRMQLDINGSYAINQKFRLFAEFLNINNQPFEAYMGNKDVVVQREYYSFWGRLGLKFDLKQTNK